MRILKFGDHVDLKILGKVNDTSDGALLDLGTDANGDAHSLLLVGISKEDLSADDFLITYL